jgi:serine/threonine protein kinase
MMLQQAIITQNTATLSEARFFLAATSSGELIFFGGGFNGTRVSDRVDIYNVKSGIWTTATLSVSRQNLAATSSGNLVFFAGGWNGTTNSNQVDIYNTSNGSWNTATLSQARNYLAATSVGDLVLFAGGYGATGPSNIVDIYNVTNNTWSNATLSQARGSIVATSVANRYALFAGGFDGTSTSNVVDIFDSVSGLWSTTTFSQRRCALAATSLGNLAFFGGGYNSTAVNIVDIFNATTQTWSTATLSQARYFLAAASIGDIVAFGGGTSDGFTTSAVVDVYNVSSDNWYTATLSQPRAALVAISSTNEIFFAGGFRNNDQLDTVDSFELSNEMHSRATSSSPLVPFLPYKQNLFVPASNEQTFAIAFSELKFDGTIGDCAFGVWFEGSYRENKVMVKKYSIPNFLSSKEEISGLLCQFHHEFEILHSLEHPNIVKYVGYCEVLPNLCIVTEHCNGGTLFDWLHVKKVKLSLQQQFEIALGIAEGMKYLHSQNPKIVHRDLKSANILLHDNVPKIFGFDLSCTKGTKSLSTRVGTPCWMAPEVVNDENYTEKIDVWSFGMVLYEITTNKIPYDYCQENVLFLFLEIGISAKTPPIPQENCIHPVLLTLMKKCWAWNPEQRPSFDDIVYVLKGIDERNALLQGKNEILEEDDEDTRLDDD